jgi:tight adherence protein C
VTGVGPYDRTLLREPQPGALVGILHRIGEAIRSGTTLYSEEDIGAIEGMLMASGLKPKQLLPIVLGAKMAFFVLTVSSAIVLGIVQDLGIAERAIAIAISLPVGLMIPEMILRLLRGPYVRALQRGVADALDLLVVCTQAGMGLESALREVSREMQYSNPAMAAALTSFLDELRVLPDPREAYRNFGRRSGVVGIRRMATILGQTLQYGTPLGQALRSMAEELRREELVRLEAKAVRLPALLVFPLVAFILPTLFIVMAGPSVMTLLDMLSVKG